VNHWWRAYNEAVNDPKLQLISDSMFRAWFNVMCIASANDGNLPALKDLAFTLRIAPTKAAQVLAQLHAAGLLDKTETGFTPHNWGGRQYKTDKPDETAAERMRNYRDRKRNAMSNDPSPLRVTERNVTEEVTDSNTVTVTVPRLQTTDTDTDTEAEKKNTPLRSDDWPKDYGDLFWRAYPRKTEKLSAMKKLTALRKSGIVTFADLMAGVKRYAAAGTEPQYTKHPTTWLNAGCWADEIQTGGGNGQRTANPRTTGHDAILAAANRAARKIAGDGEMAGPADEDKFSFGDGSFGDGARGTNSSSGRATAHSDGGKPSPEGVLEGEVIAPDKAYDGLSSDWRRH
jgi:hypothetical protein